MSASTPLSNSIARSRAPVSAIIPCYRCRSTIKRAIDSAARQSRVPSEMIVVDDGSGDDTLEFLRDLRQQLGDDWIKIVALDRNEGPGSARNAGWNAASGKYLAFLDADDAWHPRKVEIQTAFMEAHPEIALCGHAHRRLREGENGDTLRDREGYRVVTFSRLLWSNCFVTPSVMVRREVPFRFLPGRRYMEDHLLWLEIASGGLGVARLNQVLAFTYKASTGDSGLSAHTWEMRKAELANFWRLRSAGSIGFAAATALSGYSLAKQCVRVVFPPGH